eukprot:4018926-Amphidinium_carterae.1
MLKTKFDVRIVFRWDRIIFPAGNGFGFNGFKTPTDTAAAPRVACLWACSWPRVHTCQVSEGKSRPEPLKR